MNIVVYVVVETHFLDDYKARGDDWSTSKVYAFSTLDKAEAFVRAKEHIYCMVTLEECDLVNEYMDKGYLDDEGNLYEDYLDDAFIELTKGEFVPSTYVLEIDEQIIDKQCDAVTPPPFAQHKRRRRRKKDAPFENENEEEYIVEEEDAEED